MTQATSKARNYVECPTCGTHTATLDDYSQPAGAVAQAACSACHVLDREPRKPVRLGRAMAWATEQVQAGKTVYVRDVETQRTFSLNRYSRLDAMQIDQPERLVIACAIRV